jgi:hypothetical protein
VCIFLIPATRTAHLKGFGCSHINFTVIFNQETLNVPGCKVRRVADSAGQPGAAEPCHEEQQGTNDDANRRGSSPGQQGLCQVSAAARWSAR